jgi:hypothetical protein
MKNVIGVLLIALVASAEAQPPSVKMLDLTSREHELDSQLTTMNVAGGSAYGAKSLPLRLTLTRLDSDFYTRNDSFIFEVILENIGSEPIRLPWSRLQPRFADYQLNETVRGVLKLQLLDAQGGLLEGPGIMLVGISSDDTTTVLRSGEKATIKVPEKWTLSTKATALLESVRLSPVEVVATFRLEDGLTAYTKITSVNRQKVVIDQGGGGGNSPEAR